MKRRSGVGKALDVTLFPGQKGFAGVVEDGLVEFQFAAEGGLRQGQQPFSGNGGLCFGQQRQRREPGEDGFCPETGKSGVEGRLKGSQPSRSLGLEVPLVVDSGREHQVVAGVPPAVEVFCLQQHRAERQRGRGLAGDGDLAAVVDGIQRHHTVAGGDCCKDIGESSGLEGDRAVFKAQIAEIYFGAAL